MKTGDFGVPLEYLNGGNLRFWYKRFGVTNLTDLIPLLMEHRTSVNGIFGLKAHWSQLKSYVDTPILNAHLDFNKAIWIYRRDLLSQAISFAIARQTGQWISEMPKLREPEYDYDQIVKSARQIVKSNQNWKHFFKTRKNLPVKTLCFEDLTKEPAETLANVSDFLLQGSSVELSLSGTTSKQSNDTNSIWKTQFRTDRLSHHNWMLKPQAF